MTRAVCRFAPPRTRRDPRPYLKASRSGGHARWDAPRRSISETLSSISGSMPYAIFAIPLCSPLVLHCLPLCRGEIDRTAVGTEGCRAGSHGARENLRSGHQGTSSGDSTFTRIGWLAKRAFLAVSPSAPQFMSPRESFGHVEAPVLLMTGTQGRNRSHPCDHRRVSAQGLRGTFRRRQVPAGSRRSRALCLQRRRTPHRSIADRSPPPGDPEDQHPVPGCLSQGRPRFERVASVRSDEIRWRIGRGSRGIPRG